MTDLFKGINLSDVHPMFLNYGISHEANVYMGKLVSDRLKLCFLVQMYYNSWPS